MERKRVFHALLPLLVAACTGLSASLAHGKDCDGPDSAGGAAAVKKKSDASRQLAALRCGPECAGAACAAPGLDIGQTMSLFSERGGHFFSPVTINGVTVDGMIDTGASTLALDARTAEKMGISLKGARQATFQTANGAVQNNVKRVPQVRIGSIVLDNVAVSVGANTGKTLIGMSVLNRLQISAGNGRMSLSK